MNNDPEFVILLTLCINSMLLILLVVLNMVRK